MKSIIWYRHLNENIFDRDAASRPVLQYKESEIKNHEGDFHGENVSVPSKWPTGPNQNFVGPGPVRYEIWKFFLVLVRFGDRTSVPGFEIGYLAQMNLLRPGSSFGSTRRFFSKINSWHISTDNFCDKQSNFCLLDKMVACKNKEIVKT